MPCIQDHRKFKESEMTGMTSLASVSRRALFRSAGGVAGGALAAFSGGAKAQAKIPQATAGYQDSPQNDQACADCTHFTAPSACNLVDGTISPKGWCKLFAKNT
jgi:hypothetical protein